MANLIAKVFHGIAKWALVRKEFANFIKNGILYNLEALLACGSSKR